jgi:uncharacterized protein YihD (DUF1040 family)
MDGVERIQPLMALLARAWRKNPELRLGQLLSWVRSDVDLAIIEDEELARCLQAHIDGQVK